MGWGRVGGGRGFPDVLAEELANLLDVRRVDQVGVYLVLPMNVVRLREDIF